MLLQISVVSVTLVYQNAKQKWVRNNSFLSFSKKYIVKLLYNFKKHIFLVCNQ